MIAGLLTVFVLCAGVAFGQNAQLSGLIQDPSGLRIAGADLTVRNELTGGRRVTKSNESGYYSVFSLSPGVYRVSVHAAGFEAMIRDGVKLDVGENARLDFDLRVGDSRTVVTVRGDPSQMNTEDASVGTVIDRDIIEQLPLNGRGIQSLIELTPGVVVVPVVDASRGQFAVNGQRSDTNYFTVDGVSANFGAGNALEFGGNVSQGLRYSMNQAGGGMLPANNFLGTFSNLVSPDALQEFKIQTSTFAPEFGRSPGAQIGLITRSGANRYSGDLFEYLRNDKSDANDWFANQLGANKPPLRLNNFGGTLGGPLRIPHFYNGHDRTFFFLSVEDLLMAQPQPVLSFPVPTLQARQNASPTVASLLGIYPFPNRPANAGDPAVTGISQFAGAYSLRQTQQTYGLRLDHSFTDKLFSFARYNRAPSQRLRPVDGEPPSNIQNYGISTEMLTMGMTHMLNPNLVNEVRLNGSRQSANVRVSIGDIGGAKNLPDRVIFPDGFSSAESVVVVSIPVLEGFLYGFVAEDRARQLQFVDNLSYSTRTHQMKFGIDYRWFSPVQVMPRSITLLTAGNIAAGAPDIVGAGILVRNQGKVAYVVKAFSAFAQDTWRVGRRVSLTYGLRWEINPAPRVSAGQAGILGLTSLGDAASASVLPNGRPFYPTAWSNVAPRFGMGWQLRDAPRRKTVLRAGAGRFFGLAQGGLEDTGSFGGGMVYNYSNQHLGSIGTGQPLLVAASSDAALIAIAPGYHLPSTYEWNVTLEQSIGDQTFSAGYVGALGRGLIGFVRHPDPGPFPTFDVFGNNTSSSYHALQLQFNRRLSGRIRTLLSYTWSHSIDNLSNDVEGVDVTIRTFAQFDNGKLERGSSDFDVRHGLNGSVIAALPSPRKGIASMLFRNWSANSIFFARSALPTQLLSSNGYTRPDVVAGQPLYLYGPQYPGGKRYNDAAFADPPDGVQGDLGRNVLRGFGAWQIDFALHRTFKLTDKVSLQFRAEAFNILNHPNFANPSDDGDPWHLSLSHTPNFGTSAAMLATGLSSTGVPGQLNPLFQIGGPRSMQFALRVHF